MVVGAGSDAAFPCRPRGSRLVRCLDRCAVVVAHSAPLPPPPRHAERATCRRKGCALSPNSYQSHAVRDRPPLCCLLRRSCSFFFLFFSGSSFAVDHSALCPGTLLVGCCCSRGPSFPRRGRGAWALWGIVRVWNGLALWRGRCACLAVAALPMILCWTVNCTRGALTFVAPPNRGGEAQTHLRCYLAHCYLRRTVLCREKARWS